MDMSDSEYQNISGFRIRFENVDHVYRLPTLNVHFVILEVSDSGLILSHKLLQSLLQVNDDLFIIPLLGQHALQLVQSVICTRYHLMGESLKKVTIYYL